MQTARLWAKRFLEWLRDIFVLFEATADKGIIKITVLSFEMLLYTARIITNT
jgi:hypothetical protein